MEQYLIDMIQELKSINNKIDSILEILMDTGNKNKDDKDIENKKEVKKIATSKTKKKRK